MQLKIKIKLYMAGYFIKKSNIKGVISMSSSKSQTMRAVLFASIAEGKSKIFNFLPSSDVFAMIEACRKLGAEVEIDSNNLKITGSKINIKKETTINVGNSGIALRFLSSVFALTNQKINITGDTSICCNRSMGSLIGALKKLGANITSNNGFAPLGITGPITSGNVMVNGEDSQFVSSLLIALSLVNGDSEINVQNPGEKPFVDMTLDWLKRLDIKYENDGYNKYKIFGPNYFQGFKYTVPSDFSSMLFPITAALITKSDIIIKDVIFDEYQGDFKVIGLLKKLGANIEVGQDFIEIKKSCLKGGIEIDVNDFIDSVPILAVLACFIDGGLILKNASVAKKKESDRLGCITKELKKMGAYVIERTDGLIIKKSFLKPAVVSSHKDHRIAMALFVAGLNIKGLTKVEDIDCIKKSYPDFLKDLKFLGANIL